MGAGLGRLWSRSAQYSDSLRGSRIFVCFCQINNTRFHWFPVGQFSRILHTTTSIGVAMYTFRTIFCKFYYKGPFSKRRQNFSENGVWYNAACVLVITHTQTWYIFFPVWQWKVKEPVGLTRLDGKRPDGLTLIPWQGGKFLTWDVTMVSTLADSYLHSTSHSAGSAAETATVRKES